jgi:uncharacterized protein (DUF1330 family)
MSIEPTPEQFQRLAASPDEGPVAMINLLKFRDRASGIDEADGISGLEAYGRYAERVAPFLERVGGRVLMALQASMSVVGPDALEWDMVLVVEYPSYGAFLSMATDLNYLEIHGHRTAALDDARLIASHVLQASELPGSQASGNGQPAPRPTGPSNL